MKRIYDLIEIYIDDLLSVEEDAGWSGETVAAKLITYLGDIPKSTGLEQSNMAMINAIKLMKNQDPDYKLIAHAMQEISIDHYTAIIAKHVLKHINVVTSKPWTDQDRAYCINQNVNTFKDNYKRGIKSLQKQVDIIARYLNLGK